LESFLIVPVQRICKYPLFLKELVHYTPTNSPFYKTLTSAKDAISTVVEVINKRKGVMEKIERVREISEALEGSEVSYCFLFFVFCYSSYCRG